MGAIRNAIAKKVISKAAPEDVKAAGRIKKIEIMTQEMDVPEYLAHQVADGEITLAEARNMEVDQAMIRNNSEPPIAPGEFDTFQDKVAQIVARGKKLSGAAAAGSAAMPDDAEAGAALRLSKGLTPDLATNQIRNRLNKSQGRSGGKVVTDYVHNNTNYDRGFLSSLRSEPRGGEGYTSEVKKLAFDLLQSTDDPKVKQAVMEWVQPRMARGMGVGAVTAASGANAAEAEPKEQGVIANILDKMEQFELIPDEQTRTVGLELLKRELGKAIEYSEMSAKGLWGIGRGMFGLATDEAGGDTMQAMEEVWTSPNQENLNRFGRYVEDETGSRKAGATASAIGMFADPTLAF
jgi:hypothetical protein